MGFTCVYTCIKGGCGNTIQSVVPIIKTLVSTMLKRFFSTSPVNTEVKTKPASNPLGQHPFQPIDKTGKAGADRATLISWASETSSGIGGSFGQHGTVTFSHPWTRKKFCLVRGGSYGNSGEYAVRKDWDCR